MMPRQALYPHLAMHVTTRLAPNCPCEPSNGLHYTDESLPALTSPGAMALAVAGSLDIAGCITETSAREMNEACRNRLGVQPRRRRKQRPAKPSHRLVLLIHVPSSRHLTFPSLTVVRSFGERYTHCKIIIRCKRVAYRVFVKSQKKFRNT